MAIGVILVSYNTGDVLLECLESLMASVEAHSGTDLRILVVDNASPDGTLARIEAWASGARRVDADAMPVPARRAPGPVRIDARELGAEGLHPSVPPASEGAIGFLQAGRNGGFAAGVNLGLETFAAMPEVEFFWVLNSDAMVEPGTPAALEAAARRLTADGGRFGIIGGRTYLTDPPLTIQSDGGRVGHWTGRMLPVNLGVHGREAHGPEEGALEYIPGCHMLVSRDFLEHAGPMPEGYFLYFEEVDWCLRRGDLPLVWLPDAPIHHRNGSSIGSQGMRRGPSPTSAYWMFRNRMRFIRRHNPVALPVTAAYSLGKIGQFALRRHYGAARWAWRGMSGGRPPA